jgi:hypothetical protein
MTTVSFPVAPPPAAGAKPSQDGETAAALARPAAREHNLAAGTAKVTPVEAVETDKPVTLGERERRARLTIDFDKEANRYVYRLVDPRTKEVLREIPSPDVLRILRAFRSPTGVAVDKQS